MIYTKYYVNGERTNLEGYMQACWSNAYKKEATKRAVQYFKGREWEWNNFLNNLISLNCVEDFEEYDRIKKMRYNPDEKLIFMMTIYWELHTEEGRKFQEEWKNRGFWKRLKDVLI